MSQFSPTEFILLYTFRILYDLCSTRDRKQMQFNFVYRHSNVYVTYACSITVLFVNWIRPTDCEI